MTMPDTLFPPGVRPPVNSIVQAVSVLRYLGSIRRGEGVTAIARALGLSPSSCFNVLRTLASQDLVAFDGVTKTYTLGLGTIDLARRALGNDAIVRMAEPVMARLAETFDAAVGLWRLGTRERLSLAALAESAAATRIHMVVGQRQPASAGATGRAVLAASGASDDEIATAFAGIRWQRPLPAAEFLSDIHMARTRGWATDVDHINRGIATCAAAIVDASGTVRFCLSASMFSGRDTPDEVIRIGDAVRDAARGLARDAYGAGEG